ncbi:hypothetical protein CRG98_043237, partial [Punica granatum]
MQAVSPSAPTNHLKSPSLLRPPRPGPSRVVRCIYRSDPVHFPNGVGSNRADWQSSCAILNASSKIISRQEQPADSHGGGADHVAAVN